MIIILGLLVIMLICFLMDNWYIFVIGIVIAIVAVVIDRASKKANKPEDTSDFQSGHTIDFNKYHYSGHPISPETMAKQKAICEKYGFDYVEGETMSPDLLEFALKNEKEWRDNQKKIRMQNIQKRIGSLDGHEFEELCADILTMNGYEAEVTKGSGDHGADIIATIDGETYAIQVKHYSQPVGNKAVQEAHAGQAYYGTMKAAVLTNSDFTKQAIEDAEKLNVELWDCERLGELLDGVK